MPKTISEIYKEYRIMPNLQMHMLRVAAVASLICDNLDVKVNKEAILTGALLHDLGNIIKAKLDYFPEFNKPEGIEYWRGVQADFIKKYGKDAELADLIIMRELGIREEVIKYVEQMKFINLCENLKIDNLGYKIIHYCDLRVDPHGIVSYEERVREGKERYKDRESFLHGTDYEKLFACGKETERLIFSKCKIEPEDINDKTAEPVIAELKNFVIK